jgi:hypothetical protein
MPDKRVALAETKVHAVDFSAFAEQTPQILQDEVVLNLTKELNQKKKYSTLKDDSHFQHRLSKHVLKVADVQYF